MPRESDLVPHVPVERAELFTAEDGGSTENEYLELLAGLVRCTKPLGALETGFLIGAGTVAISQALMRNGVGTLHSVDHDVTRLSVVTQRLIDAGVPKRHWELYHADSVRFIEGWAARGGEVFQIAFLDSDLPLRAQELKLLLQHELLAPGAVVAVHDTARTRTFCDGATKFWAAMQGVSGLRRIELPLSRGMTLFQVDV